MTNEAVFDDDAEYQAEADEVYAELVARIGEANPRPRLEPTRDARQREARIPSRLVRSCVGLRAAVG